MSSLEFSQQAMAHLRADTPGVSQVIHLNNAGAALMPEVVGNAVLKYIRHEMKYGGYETAEKFRSKIDLAYDHIAHYLSCSPSEIAICENATTAWDQAFLSIPLESKDEILCSAAEYASNYIPFLQLAKRTGVQIRTIPNNEYGQVDINALERLINDRVKLIAITHVPTNGGLVNPACKIGQIAKRHQVWYLLDACQSVGQMPLNVREIGCDFLSATSRKYLRGPRGVGFLFARQETTGSLEPIILDLHAASWKSEQEYEIRADARKYENWETNLSGVVGLGAAVGYMLDIGIDRIWARIQLLADYLRSRLSTVPGVRVHDLGKTKCGIVSFSSPRDALELKKLLNEGSINVSVIHPSHTLIDMQSRGLGHLIRASVHYYNTEEEIDTFIEYLKHVV
ncbi:MAG: aminotransferase class V [Cyclobacteriaceae bacterium]|nr:MAG: aminotransferase class V [Cyclobacteriaceae bacterium]